MTTSISSHHTNFVNALQASSFSGDIETDLASRVAGATDNSIYHVQPELLVYPKTQHDIQQVLELLSQPRFRSLSLTARGASTGTNGQSLNDGIVLDVKRHMQRILEINLDEGYAWVEAGVVLDQLNTALAPHGVFFAPHLSPSDRATLGGMASTDACGQGSCVHGKTSDHVLALDLVLNDGQAHRTTPLSAEALDAYCHEDTRIGTLYKNVRHDISHHAKTIEQRFPKLNRFMTGYNLAKTLASDGSFNMNYLITGSEGTLAVISALKLKLTPKPQYQCLFALAYDDFQTALCSSRSIAAFKPAATEIVDDNVLRLARQDPIYHSLKDVFKTPLPEPLSAMVLVEFSGKDAVARQQAAQFSAYLNTTEASEAAATLFTEEATDIQTLWAVRKKSVGLLGKTAGTRRPLPFVEDTVVPPEHLPEYIKAFREILDRHQLHYGMFGHVDAGCLHVRPALDLRQSTDRALLESITEEVAALTEQFGGLLWGEHGKGFRSRYVERYFGSTLYQVMGRIKAYFDPHNQLNPGKIVSPHNAHPLVDISGPLKADIDQTIPSGDWDAFGPSMYCNGNAACLTQTTTQLICPSFKATRQQKHSPKGRAQLLRQWLATQHAQGTSTTEKKAFSKGVYDALSGCLGCKGCKTQCPVQVDIPTYKARFLECYHKNHRRPVRDYVLLHLEALLSFAQRTPRLSHWILKNKLTLALFKKIGLVDLPLPAQKHHKTNGCAPFIFPNEKERPLPPVAFVPDALTSCFEPVLVQSTYELLQQLAKKTIKLKCAPSGKVAHNLGFKRHFKRLGQKNMARFQKAIEQGYTLVSLEPSITLSYQDEYKELINTPPTVDLLATYLSNLPKLDRLLQPNIEQKPYYLLSHCTEAALAPTAAKQWQTIFNHFGLQLEIIATGCCGMAGNYGHSIEHQKTSEALFEMHWQPIITRYETEQLLATGFSCRCQVKRFTGHTLKHPIQVLYQQIQHTG